MVRCRLIAAREDGGVVPAPDPVAEYFSDQAAGYRARATRRPWAWIRAWEARAVRSLLGDVSGLDVADLGAGAGFYTRELIRLGARHVWAVDLSSAMLAELPSGPVTPVLGDATTVRLGRRFSTLLSAGMLEFVPDRAAVLANAADHAEAGARFVVLVPRVGGLGRLYRRFHRAHGLDVHLFDRAWFDAAAPRCGWRVVVARPVLPFALTLRLQRR
jgi:SAM-dependent methyltransferase